MGGVSMKPLVIITVYNRTRETQATLDALAATTDLSMIELVIVDNGSTDGADQMIVDWCEDNRGRGENIVVHSFRENLGCPRALNLALDKHRCWHQPVIKLDNDVKLLSSGWIDDVARLVEWYYTSEKKNLAMVSAYYPGVLGDSPNPTARLRKAQDIWIDDAHSVLYHIAPVIGHAVYHTGAFMDWAGYFDVLAPEHLYGFEDLLMSQKAIKIGWDMVAWDGWQVENLQRHNSLGDRREGHIEAMRPLYNERVRALAHGGNVCTGRDGKPLSDPGDEEGK